MTNTDLKKLTLFLPAILIITLMYSCTSLETKPDPMIKTGEISFCAAGDVMIDRGVKKRIDQKGPDFIFEQAAGFIKHKDLSFCNLEGPVSLTGTRKNGGFAFRGLPENLDILKKCGFDFVSVANNHMLDYGSGSLTDTFSYLKEAGISYAGAGATREEAHSYVIKEVNGIKVAFIAELDMPFVVDEVPLSAELPQMSHKRGIDDLVLEVKKAREAADLVMVSFHWGYEYTHKPQWYQKKYAKACIDAGADIILGHHPHVMQGIEVYKGKLILYSMGNLVFDQFRKMTSRTFLFSCDLKKNGKIKNAFITPVLIKQNRPTFARGDAAKEIRELMKNISKKFGTKFEERDGRLYIEGL